MFRFLGGSRVELDLRVLPLPKCYPARGSRAERKTARAKTREHGHYGWAQRLYCKDVYVTRDGRGRLVAVSEPIPAGPPDMAAFYQ